MSESVIEATLNLYKEARLKTKKDNLLKRQFDPAFARKMGIIAFIFI